jgi:uncharacterized membrane protein (GlpM family)
MTTQLLATELANLIQESKRKHSDLRQVCAFPLWLQLEKLVAFCLLTYLFIRQLKDP